MLRSTVLILALANAGYYAWSHGLLPLGPSTSTEEAEPQRLAQQLNPEALLIVPKAGSGVIAPKEEILSSPPTPPEPATEAATPPAATPAPGSAPTPAPAAEMAAPPTPPATPAAVAAPPVTPALASPVAPAVAPAVAAAPAESKPEVKAPTKPPTQTLCLQAGAFNAAQADTLRKALSSLPANSWTLNNTTLPGRWMVYMGRFQDLDALNKKRNELQDRNIAYDRPRIPALEPGLSLGRYSTEEAAERALAQLGTKGVRTARVIQERAETTAFVLRLPAVEVNARQRITNTLRPALADRTLHLCERD